MAGPAIPLHRRRRGLAHRRAATGLDLGDGGRCQLRRRRTDSADPGHRRAVHPRADRHHGKDVVLAQKLLEDAGTDDILAHVGAVAVWSQPRLSAVLETADDLQRPPHMRRAWKRSSRGPLGAAPSFESTPGTSPDRVRADVRRRQAHEVGHDGPLNLVLPRPPARPDAAAGRGGPPAASPAEGRLRSACATGRPGTPAGWRCTRASAAGSRRKAAACAQRRPGAGSPPGSRCSGRRGQS
jgi:hypothetical protein